MYTGLLHAHSGLRYITLALILIVIIQSIIGWGSKRKFTSAHKKLVGTSVVVLVFQFAIGIALFFMSSKVMFDAATMKNALLRFFTVEHPLMMLIAFILIIFSYSKAKSYSNYITHKRLFWYHFVALLIIIASIPWPFREQLGVTWF